MKTLKVVCVLVLFWANQAFSSTKAKEVPCNFNYKKPIQHRISEQKCREYTEQTPCILSRKPTEDNIYVEDAKTTDFRHMALILSKITTDVYHENCDGILISNRFILTTAHCTEVELRRDSLVTLVARLGDHITEPSSFDGINQIEVPIKSVYKHPKYTNPFEYHDIGLLELKRDVEFTDYISPACVSYDQPEDNRAYLTTNMAYNRYTLAHSKKLQKFHLRVISNEECKVKGQPGVGNTQMCAIHAPGLNDTHCLEAAGSPLQVATQQNRCVFRVLGVTSFLTTVCGDSPAVFARVASYVDWIEEIVWPTK